MRATHKLALKTILETITFEGKSLSVQEYYKNNSLIFPYIFITSGDLRTVIADTGSYREEYDYFITAVFNATVNSQPGQEEVRIDTFEELVKDKLTERSVRHITPQSTWLVLRLTEISSPFRAGEVLRNDDNNLLKIFSVTATVDAVFN